METHKFYAIKTPRGVILTFTISSSSKEAKAELEKVENKGWDEYLKRGYKVVCGRFVEDE